MTASSSTKAGSKEASPSCADADQRRRDRLMRAALRRQRDAGRRRRQHEARVLVAGIVHRIEAALDEGIVERADRQQPLAVDGMRQAQRREQDEQVHLGDAELHVLALRREIPVEGRRDLLAAEQVGFLGAGKKPAAIDPGAEIGRDRNVGRRRDDARRKLAIAARDLVQHQAKTLLRRHLRRGLEVELLRHVDDRRGQPARALAVERARRRGTPSAQLRPATGPRTSPIHGRAECSGSRAISPSALPSSGRHGCPCGPGTAGRHP